MNVLRRWNINARTQIISLGPALLLTLLLISFFTVIRLQDLRDELDRSGQMIASQLAPASEYGVLSGNIEVLASLINATLAIPNVRFVEIRDRSNQVLVVEANPQSARFSLAVRVFKAPIQLQRVTLDHDPLLDRNAASFSARDDYLGQVIVGISNQDLSQRQQDILLKAGVLALFAVLFTYLLARRLAANLSRPISAIVKAVKAIQNGDYQASLPVVDDAELGDLARHINSLAAGLDKASHEQQLAIEQLIHTREEAEAANHAKTDFLAMMSHELRTPMNGVLGMLQLLETTPLNEEQAEYAALASESTEHLLKVINDILDFSRIERSTLELEHIGFNLASLLSSCTQAFQHHAAQKGLQLHLSIPPDMQQLHVSGDPTRIRQILLNLMGNALKFTEHGSVHIEPGIQILDQDLLWFSCSVRDTGIGISAERLERMFEPFQQADSSISRRYGGTGLGLPIARALAERIGGTLHARSEASHGSVFTLEIPLALNQPPTSAELPALPHRRQSGEGGKVLLVEDSPVNQIVIEAMLRSLGFEVCVVGDGAQAVNSAKAQAFTAILMDCRLPGIDGYEATRQIRLLPDWTDRPIIALTANALQGDREICLQAGMNDYLSKPFKRTDLQQILQRWVL